MSQQRTEICSRQERGGAGVSGDYFHRDKVYYGDRMRSNMNLYFLLIRDFRSENESDPSLQWEHRLQRVKGNYLFVGETDQTIENWEEKPMLGEPINSGLNSPRDDPPIEKKRTLSSNTLRVEERRIKGRFQ